MSRQNMLYLELWLLVAITPSVLRASETYCYYNESFHLSNISCTRLCHCASGDCGEDNSGRCPCATGWMGDHCQYANIAEMTVATSTGYNISLRVTYPVSAMRIKGPGQGTFSLTIRVGFHGTEGSFDSCYNGYVVLNQIYSDVFCDYPIPGNAIMLETNMLLEDDSIEVYGGRNVALWQRAWQSSSYQNIPKYSSLNAVDGLIGGRNLSSGGTCTLTQRETYPWWRVKIDGVYSISWIHIANRNTMQYRLGGFEILFRPDLVVYKDTTDFSDDTYTNPGDFITIDLINSNILPAKTREDDYVQITINRYRIQNRDFHSRLTFCEVQLFACRPIRSGNENCLGFCSDNCAGDGFCNKYDCSLCNKGWTGPKCNERNETERYCTAFLRKSACEAGHCDACDYLCHCKDGAECDLFTGKCPNGCDRGWMGRACQYANVAFRKTSISTLSDGLESSCRSRRSKTTVRLLKTVLISSLQLTVYDSGPVNIMMRIKTENGLEMCISNWTIDKRGDIFCSHFIRGFEIIIDSDTPIGLCEIQIYGGRNVAFWQMATQSSRYIINGNTVLKADLAVDGKTDNDYRDIPYTCQVTTKQDYNDSNPWWKLNLRITYAIFKVNVYFSSAYPASHKGFIIRTSKDGNVFNEFYTDQSSNPDVSFQLNIMVPFQSQFLEVSIPGDFLSICEFEAYACFPKRNGKENCVSFCPNNCKESENCYNTNFTCPECQPGWTGQYCETEVTCSVPPATTIVFSSNQTTYKYDEVIVPSCIDGYEAARNLSMRCSADGTWDDIPICEEIICFIPTEDSLTFSENRTEFKYMEIVAASCRNGKEDVVLQCISSNMWNDTFPNCNIIGSHGVVSSSQIAGIAGGSAVSLIVIAIATIIFVLVLLKRKRNVYEDETVASGIRRCKDETTKISESATYDTKHDVETKNRSVYYEFTEIGTGNEHFIKLEDFAEFFNKKKDDQGEKSLGMEFSKLKAGLQFNTDAAKRPENHKKNKYRNIYPYDQNRVILSKENNKPDSDYINASYIHGHGRLRTYIAAQAPILSTLSDFWRMVWQEKACKIVMLTNLVEEKKFKCKQYWPDTTDTAMDEGGLSIRLVNTFTQAEFAIRTISVSNAEDFRLVKQFHFTVWPDKGIPANPCSLVRFWSKVFSSSDSVENDCPIVVHCSAGVGRTGTFIALDILANQAKETGFVDVLRCVETLRRQRVNMIQTKAQYVFLHETLQEILKNPIEAIAANDFPSAYRKLLEFDALTRKQKLQLAYEKLNESTPKIPDTEFAPGKEASRRGKNRYNNILPVNSERPLIEPMANGDQYINAVFLPGFKDRRTFIVTQTPLPNTVEDFWRLVHGQGVTTIVMLDANDDNPEDNVGIYWTDEGIERKIGKYVIKTESTVTDISESFNVVNLTYSYGGEVQEQVRLFKANFWPRNEFVPPTAPSLLKMIEEVDGHQRSKDGPIIVQCLNGCDRSGLYCVCQVVLERLKVEQEVAITDIIKQMRSRRPQIIPNFEQFQFCHEVVIAFMEDYGEYSNFRLS